MGIKAYDGAYAKAMEGINGRVTQHQALAVLALSWITCAKLRLKTEELLPCSCC
jgi:hypothetical protein